MKSINHANSLQYRQRGAGMLEILISILVLAIGLLGLAALQSVGLKYNYQSLQRTQAVMLTYDLVDKMRSNSAAVTNGDYLINFGVDPGVPAAGTCQATACSPTQMAQFDTATWKQSIKEQLGDDADGRVTYDGARLHTITIQWKENEIDQQLVQEIEL